MHDDGQLRFLPRALRSECNTFTKLMSHQGLTAGFGRGWERNQDKLSRVEMIGSARIGSPRISITIRPS
jgi:hypothetical protein